MEEAVTNAHETSDAFSDETLREQAVFQVAKQAEMKEALGNLADGQIEFYKSVSLKALLKHPITLLFLITNLRRWRSGSASSPSSSGYASMSEFWMRVLITNN